MNRLYLDFPVKVDPFPSTRIGVMADLKDSTPGRPKYVQQSPENTDLTAAFGFVEVFFGNSVISDSPTRGIDENIGYETFMELKWYNPRDKSQRNHIRDTLVEDHRKNNSALIQVLHGPVFRYRNIRLDGPDEYWALDLSAHMTAYLGGLQQRIAKNIGLDLFPNAELWNPTPTSEEVEALKAKLDIHIQDEDFEECAKLRDLINQLQGQVDKEALIQEVDQEGNTRRIQ